MTPPSDAREAAEVLAQAHQVHGPPAPRRDRSPSTPPAARAPSAVSPSAPARPAPAGRARPAPRSEEPRPLWMIAMGLPITGLGDLVLARIARLEELAGPGGYEGWGREGGGPFFVDVAGARYRGESLNQALSAALAAARAP